MSLGLTAKIIQEINPNHKITKTNIDAFLFETEANKINVS
jgi:hypothetical protein